MPITIRPAKIEDSKAIVHAEKEIALEPGIFCSQPSELKEESVIQSISKGIIYLVAEENGIIVGHGFLEPLPLESLKHVGELNLVVHKGFQGRGIGSLLLKKIVEAAKKSQMEKIELNVRTTNTRAITLYQKMGFVEEGRLRKRVKVGKEYIDDIVMGLML